MNRLNDFQKATEAAQLNQKAYANTNTTTGGENNGNTSSAVGGNRLYQPFQKSSVMEQGESLSIPPVITPEDEEMEMPRFFAQVNEIKESNKRVHTFMVEISKLHKEALATTDSHISEGKN